MIIDTMPTCGQFVALWLHQGVLWSGDYRWAGHTLEMYEEERDRWIDVPDDFIPDAEHMGKRGPQKIRYITFTDYGQEEEKPDEAWLEAARSIHQVEGECEIDNNAQISYSSDGGAYVQAWVWVPDGEGLDNPES